MKKEEMEWREEREENWIRERINVRKWVSQEEERQRIKMKKRKKMIIKEKREWREEK